jgi:hypothetical protein
MLQKVLRSKRKKMKKEKKYDEKKRKVRKIVRMTPLSIQDQFEKFRSINKSRQMQKPHRYMEMSEEGNKELQRMVTSLWTFSFPNINACKYAFNFRCNILFFSSNNNLATRRTT